MMSMVNHLTLRLLNNGNNANVIVFLVLVFVFSQNKRIKKNVLQGKPRLPCDAHFVQHFVILSVSLCSIVSGQAGLFNQTSPPGGTAGFLQCIGLQWLE